jgi:hypothetical protein
MLPHDHSLSSVAPREENPRIILMVVGLINVAFVGKRFLFYSTSPHGLAD